MKILVIGGGNMGLTYAQSFIKAKVVESQNLMILEKDASRINHLKKMDIGDIYNTPEVCIPLADLVILAVKPQSCEHLFKEIKPLIDPQQLFISIMAGVTIKQISEGLGVDKVIRSMPNLPAQIGMGMTGFTSTDAITRIELVMVQNLLSTTGKTVYISKESMIDAVTAISGSGPAYVYFFMNAMIESAVNMGFTKSEAELLVGQTFIGAVHLQTRNRLSCSDWINKVASKGGTTEAALNKFNALQLHESIKQGTDAALNRAVELGAIK